MLQKTITLPESLTQVGNVIALQILQCYKNNYLFRQPHRSRQSHHIYLPSRYKDIAVNQQHEHKAGGYQ